MEPVAVVTVVSNCILGCGEVFEASINILAMSETRYPGFRNRFSSLGGNIPRSGVSVGYYL
jgi:hypothetical protein